MIHRLSDRSFLEYAPQWLDADGARLAFDMLRESLPWEERSIVLFGRSVLQPRLIAWAGELPYRYSGQTLPIRAFLPPLAALRERVIATTGVAFNHALVNRYRDGNDSMGFHSDDEPELGEDPVVASVSLGATRRFVVTEKRGSRREALDLEDGSLLVMGGQCQREFRHGVPKTKAAVGERINITWRRIVTRVSPD